MTRKGWLGMVIISVVVIAFAAYERHFLAARPPQVAASVPAARARHSVAVRPNCGCAPPVLPPLLPTTPVGWKVWNRQQKEYQEQEAKQEAIVNKRVVGLLHRFVRVGMTQQQVRHWMGEPGEQGSSIAPHHPADDADYYGDYVVVYSPKLVVTWFGYGY